MALYHLHCDCVGRSKGKTSVGASAYRSCEKITNATDGVTHDYRRKKGLLYKEILTPDNAPEFCQNRTTLWNAVEKKENRKNSVFAKDIDIALQDELTLEQNIDCIKKWIKQNATDLNLVADLCIHDEHKDKNGNGNKNKHAHILLTTRKVNSDGWTEKAFSNLAQEHAWLDNARTSLAKIFNEEFRRLGIKQTISEKTLEEQGIDRQPQQHQGVIATAIERDGGTARRSKIKDELEKNNEEEIEKETENKLSQNEEFNQLQMLETVIQDADRISSNLEKKFNGNVNNSERLFYHLKLNCAVSMIEYLAHNNTNYEKSFYYTEKNLGATQLRRETAAAQLQTLKEIDPNERKTMIMNEQTINAGYVYYVRTRDVFPERFSSIKNWLENTTSAIATKAYRTYKKLLGFTKQMKKLGLFKLPKIEEQNKNLNVKKNGKKKGGIGGWSD